MSFSRPAVLPRWADVSGAIVAPSSGKLDVGWIPGERPPAQYLNDWMLKVYNWIGYFSNQNGGEMSVGLGGAQGATGINSTLLPLYVKATGAYLFKTDAIPLPVGARINFYRIRVVKAGASNITVTLNKYATNVVLGAGVPVPVNIDSSSVTGAAATYDQTTTVGSPVAITSGEKWYLQVEGTDTGDLVMHLNVFWDRPSA